MLSRVRLSRRSGVIAEAGADFHSPKVAMSDEQTRHDPTTSVDTPQAHATPLHRHTHDTTPHCRAALSNTHAPLYALHTNTSTLTTLSHSGEVTAPTRNTHDKLIKTREERAGLDRPGVRGHSDSIQLHLYFTHSPRALCLHLLLAAAA